ncbi:hypothetical protein [Demequina aestuarii]|uniref:hypothetical protein n=1 Tax=Demequina aestuarii TaxID=327095 RepID=UPI000A9AA303|nr:hypothetical protein [Demequina aestuarii]
MVDNAAQPTDGDVEEYLATIEPAGRREDGFRLLTLMADVTGEAPTTWGAATSRVPTR